MLRSRIFPLMGCVVLLGIVLVIWHSTEGAAQTLRIIGPTGGAVKALTEDLIPAFEAATGRLCGISLASLVAPDCGHITQICVSPTVQGSGIGYSLLRQSLTALREMGCRSATLTVTASNRGAVDLYLRVGFEILRRFSAFVWERW